MTTPKQLTGTFILAAVAAVLSAHNARAADPLPSWNDTAPKKALLTFVEKVSKEGSPDFVPVPERIATFEVFTLARISPTAGCSQSVSIREIRR